jgi:hypothetical protein
MNEAETRAEHIDPTSRWPPEWVRPLSARRARPTIFSDSRFRGH